MNNTKYNVILFLGCLVGLLLLLNVLLLNSLGSTIATKAQQVHEATIPAKIELISILTPDCTTCYNISIIKSQLRDAEITSDTELKFSDSKAKDLIEKYNITKLPAIIIKGDTSKSSAISKMVSEIGIEQEDGSVVISALVPPYIDANTGKLRGQVSLIVLSNEDCPNCFDIKPLITQLKTTLSVKDFQEFDLASKKGQELISKYNIEVLPTIIFDKEASVYPMISEVWPLVGSIESDGFYVMRNVNPPFYNISTGKVEGQISLTVITDLSCKTCYDAAKINKAILAQMGIIIQDEKNVDISSLSGKDLIDKYQITKVPTIILQGDMDKYPSLTQSWKSVGSIETDGAYILRKIEIFEQPYKNVETGEIVEPKPKTAPNNPAESATIPPTTETTTPSDKQ